MTERARRPGPRVFGVLALLLCLTAQVWSPTPAVWLREQVFDRWQRLSPRERVSAPVTIVSIDSESLAARGLWPWPRDLSAQLLEAIGRYEPKVVGVDVMFTEQDRNDPAGDARLLAAVQKMPTVLVVSGEPMRDRRFASAPRSAPFRMASPEVAAALKSYPGHQQSWSALSDAAAGLGAINADVADGLIRRAPMVTRIGDTPVPSLTAEVLRVAMGAESFRLAGARGGLLELGIGDVGIPLQQDGLMWIRYSRTDPQRFVSAESVLAGKIDPEILKDKIVLVGTGATGLLDVQYTPTGETVDGVEIHAQILEQIFDGIALTRPAWTRLAETLWLLATAALVVLLVPRIRAMPALALGLAGIGLPLLLSYGAFHAHLLLDGAVPAVGFAAVLTVTFIATFFERDRQARQLAQVQARMAGELEAARRIQVGLLPDTTRTLASEPRMTVRALLEPARTVGGDFFDCFKIDEDRVFFVVADVSGKGMPAALFMAMSKAILKANAVRERASDKTDVGAIMSRTNSEIGLENTESLFVTVFAGVLHLRSGLLSYCNAGHEPPLARTPDGGLMRFEVASGPPLCVVDDFAYETAHHQMVPGEWVCVVSDGVTEALDAKGELYGATRLSEAIERLPAAANTTQATASVRSDVAAFVRDAEPSDDLTLMCLGWQGAEGALSAR